MIPEQDVLPVGLTSSFSLAIWDSSLPPTQEKSAWICQLVVDLSLLVQGKYSPYFSHYL